MAQQAQQRLQVWSTRWRIVFGETVAKGFERLPATLNHLFTGGHRGKLLVEVD